MDKWKFILVDDSKMSNKILSDILIEADFLNVITFSSALEALDYLEKEENPTYDILITDLIMPHMNGIELSKAVKANNNFSEIPIIMITSSKDVENLQSAFNAGVIDYITKPFNPLEVVTRIKSVLNLKEETLKRIHYEKSLEVANKTLLDDLSIARHLQFQLLPQPISAEDISINGFYLPVMSLGGDLYYWQKIDDHRYGLILLDIMGHGTATSMITMYIRSILPKLLSDYKKPAEFIKYLNEFIIDFNENLQDLKYHCSTFYIIFDTENKTIEYVNAGHPPLPIIQSDKSVQWMDKGCPPIGIFKNIKIIQETIYYTADSFVITYSDGMFELFKMSGLDINILNNRFAAAYDRFLENDIAPLNDMFKEIEDMDRTDDVSLVLVKL